MNSCFGANFPNVSSFGVTVTGIFDGVDGMRVFIGVDGAFSGSTLGHIGVAIADGSNGIETIVLGSGGAIIMGTGWVVTGILLLLLRGSSPSSLFGSSISPNIMSYTPVGLCWIDAIFCFKLFNLNASLLKMMEYDMKMVPLLGSNRQWPYSDTIGPR